MNPLDDQWWDKCVPAKNRPQILKETGRAWVCCEGCGRWLDLVPGAYRPKRYHHATCRGWALRRRSGILPALDMSEATLRRLIQLCFARWLKMWRGFWFAGVGDDRRQRFNDPVQLTRLDMKEQRKRGFRRVYFAPVRELDTGFQLRLTGHRINQFGFRYKKRQAARFEGRNGSPAALAALRVAEFEGPAQRAWGFIPSELGPDRLLPLPVPVKGGAHA